MSYQVKQGDTITDAVLNSTGLIGNWSAVLDENNYDSWTPDLISGEVVNIPQDAPIDFQAVQDLLSYPACNSSSETLYGLIEQILLKLLVVPDTKATVIPPQVQDTNVYYKVRYGETIGDVIMNASGNIQNWSLVLDSNSFDWIPQLTAGQVVAIPNSVIQDLNTFRALTVYPANNNSENDIYNQIDAIFVLLNDLWILANGFWNDQGLWFDTAFWID